MNDGTPDLKRHPVHGYWYYDSPGEAALRAHYEHHYFQQNAIYSSEYDQEELDFFRASAARKIALIQAHATIGPSTHCLELGVGEGWSLAALRDAGASVVGIDYSLHGVRKWNASLESSMRVGDPERELAGLLAEGASFDLVWLDNVLEHVPDPARTLAQLRDALAPGGLLLAEIPNDESELQAFLLREGLVKAPYWLSYPEHLSYFSLESATSLMAAHGFTRLDAIADVPIDMFLFNESSNYVMDRSKGKPAHRARMRFDRLVSERGAGKSLSFFRSLANEGFGRNLTMLFRKR
jgi:SAM-dependent methyltransferase